MNIHFSVMNLDGENNTISIYESDDNDLYVDSGIDEFMKHSTSEIVEMVYQIVIFLIGTPLNIHAFIQLSKKQKGGYAESRLTKFSRQLIITHLMVLVMCLWRTYWFYNIIWNLGNVLCKIHSFAYALPFHLWSNIVAAISIDMLCCIHSPLSSYRNGTKRVNYLIGSAWFIAIVCASPMFLFKETVVVFANFNFYQCSVSDKLYNLQNAWNLFHVITVFYIPLSIVLICYTLIGVSLRRQMAHRKSLQDESQLFQNNHTTVRFLKATIAIIIAFILTWLPYQVMALLRVICKENSNCSNIYNQLNWLQAIMIASTCTNPFLYKFVNFNSSQRAYNLAGSTNENGISFCNNNYNHGSNVCIRYNNDDKLGKRRVSRCKHLLVPTNCLEEIKINKEKKTFDDIPNDKEISTINKFKEESTESCQAAKKNFVTNQDIVLSHSFTRPSSA
uniref:G_PROTEIN_RECEP_F1_2 domain-containing protein n=1 Tax=Parastrongyloides trichosuri TaxID=131310 RepID=A0A0N4ZAZ8_PARTI